MWLGTGRSEFMTVLMDWYPFVCLASFFNVESIIFHTLELDLQSAKGGDGIGQIGVRGGE